MEKRLGSIVKTVEDVMDEDEDEDEDAIDVTRRDINMNQCDINITQSCDGMLNFKYSLAKQPPHQNLTIEQLTQKFSTLNFLPAFSSFLGRHLPGTTVTPSNRDRFDAYKQIHISLPSNGFLGDNILMDRVRTAPSIKASGRALEKAAHFDTAFVVEDLSLYKSEGGLLGLLLSFLINSFISHFFFLRRSSCCSSSIDF